MGESPTKKVLDSALKALLAGLELSPWVKIPATFVTELSSRFRGLSEPEKQALATAAQEDVRDALPAAVGDQACDQPNELAGAVRESVVRGRVLDYLFDLAPPAVDELVSRVQGAAANVTKNAPVRRKVAEFVEWVESAEGPGINGLMAVLPNFR